MKYFDKTFWKFTAWFLLILGLGIAALALSTDYLERNQTADLLF